MTIGKNNTTLIAVVIVVAILAGAAGYIIAPRGAPAGETYQEGYDTGYEEGIAEGRYPNGVLKIGLLGPMTGSLASEGEAMLMGCEWAVEEINALGGICGYKLEIVQGDTEDLEPSKVTAIIEKLINEDDVSVIFCGYGNQALIEFDTVSEYNMMYFIGADWMAHQDKWAANPDKYKTCFNLVSSYEPYRTHIPETFDKWIREGNLEKINDKIAIVYSDNYYSSWIAEGLKENFESYGYETSLYEMVPFGTVTEWGPILAKIRADPPGLIINTDYIPSNEAAFVEQFLENPTNSHLFIQYAPHTPEFVELLAEKSTGVIYNSPNIGIYTAGNEPGAEHLQRAVDRFGSELPGYTYTVYNEIWIYKQGCELAQALYESDPAEASDWLTIAGTIESKTSYLTGSGPYLFDETHCIDKRFATPVIYQLWEGERLTVEPDSFANADIQMPPWWTD
jgi:branched-chain amino acid transport system substrate-binding protein